MASFLPPFPTGLVHMAIFPFVEGQQWEFKQSASANCCAKLVDTVCAFLNSAGGHMIFGIADDGKMCGIRRTDVDAILLRVDSIIHTSILKNTTTGGNVKPEELTAFAVQLTPTHFLAVIRAQSATAGHIFKQNSGDAMYRLAASNFAAKTFVFGNEATMKGLQAENDRLRTTIHQMRVATEKLQRENDILIKENQRVRTNTVEMTKHNVELLQALQTATVAVAPLEYKLTATNTKLDAVVGLLHERILAEKAEAEAQLKRSRGWLCGIFA